MRKFGAALLLVAVIAQVDSQEPTPNTPVVGEQKQDAIKCANENPRPTQQGLITCNPNLNQAVAKNEATQENPQASSKGIDVLGWLTLIVIAGQLLVYLMQRNLMRDQKNISQQQIDYFKRRERAFVSIKSLDTNQNGSTWVMAPVWGNTGGTPTKKMTGHISCAKFRQSDMPDDYTFPDLAEDGNPVDKNFRAPSFYLGPQTEIGAGPIQLSAAEMIAVHRGTMNIYVYGWARYNDIFDGTLPHVTKFCYKIIVREEGARHRIHVSFHTRHNCADEECDSP